MKKKSWIILIVCMLLVAALVVALVLLLDKGDDGSLDSDGDGRPDSVDVEPDDNLEGDNVTKVDDIFEGIK